MWSEIVEYMIADKGGNIWFIRKLDSGGFHWEEHELTGRGKTVAVLLMDREDSGVDEVAETSTTPEECVLTRAFGIEPPEVLFPGVVVVPVQKIDHRVLPLLLHVQRMSTLAAVVELSCRQCYSHPAYRRLLGCLRCRLDNGCCHARIV